VNPITPPASVEIEQALLGHLLTHWDAIADVRSTLAPRDFSDAGHSVIYRALIEAAAIHDDDSIFLKMQRSLDQHPALLELGGWEYVADLAGNVHGWIDAEASAAYIVDLAKRRAVMQITDRAYSHAADLRTPAATDTIRQLEGDLLAITAGRDARRSVSFADAAREALAAAEAAYVADGTMAGLPTGLTLLDQRLGGLRKGDLIVLAARPSMGKTAMALNIGVHCAKLGSSVGVFSLEMAAEALALRAIAEQAGIPASRISRGDLNAGEFDLVSAAEQSLRSLPMQIYDVGSQTPHQLRSEARRIQQEHGLDLMVVDYLQLMEPAGGATKNRVEDVARITRSLKQLARELNVPVLLLSQLNRSLEARDDKRPQLSDLRDSGSIEQDADVVLFIYREEYYLGRTQPDPSSSMWEKWEAKMAGARGKAEIATSKFRQGAVGRDVVAFDGALTRFYDADQHTLPEWLE